MDAAFYRVKQFWWALRAQTTAEDRQVLNSRLSPQERQLFAALAMPDQQHSLDVFRLLVKWGYQDDDLLRAALLHDVGKSLVRIRLWHRVAIVLGNALSQELVNKWASDDPRAIGYPFFVHRHHPDLGARLLEQLGTSCRVIELTKQHNSNSDDELAEALRRADDLC